MLSNSIPASSKVTSHNLYPSLKKLADRNGGLLIVGHGTRSIAGQNQLIVLANDMQEGCSYLHMQSCFLELAEPSIEAGLRLLASKSVKRILIVPILLFTAAHAKEDIPDAVMAIADSLDIEVVGQSSSLNLHPHALALSQLRFAEALEDQARSDSTFYSDDFTNVALVMIGRGTSQAEARDAMRRFVDLECQRYPVAWSAVGFFAGDEITVEKALDQAARQSQSNTIVVQPHLLFEGELSEQLREYVVRYQATYPEKKWLLAKPLGSTRHSSDLSLSETYLALAEEAAATFLL